MSLRLSQIIRSTSRCKRIKPRSYPRLGAGRNFLFSRGLDFPANDNSSPTLPFNRRHYLQVLLSLVLHPRRDVTKLIRVSSDENEAKFRHSSPGRNVATSRIRRDTVPICRISRPMFLHPRKLGTSFTSAFVAAGNYKGN